MNDDAPSADELAYDAWQRAQHVYDPTADMPTDEELAQEAAYYASLEQADAAAEQAYTELVGNDDGDDMGYCGPTCGRFGDW